MRDLLVIVPSRGRPGAVTALWDAVRETSRAATDLLVAVDDDDPQRGGYDHFRRLMRGTRRLLWAGGPRASLSGWTNTVAAAHVGGYRFLCSMGDDHRPRTDGWDVRLMAALGGTVGIAYGNDRLQGRNLPTAAVISSPVVAALGWMMLPSLAHYYVDDVWKAVGSQAGCLRYVPDVTVEHLHYLRTGAAPDVTYRQAELGWHADQNAYTRWLADGGLREAAATVRALIPAEVRV